MIWLIVTLLVAAAALALYFHLRPKALMPLKASLALWSQQLNLAVSFAITYLIADNGQIIHTLIGKLPEPWNMVLAPFAGFLAFMVVSYLRLAPQAKLQQPGQVEPPAG